MPSPTSLSDIRAEALARRDRGDLSSARALLEQALDAATMSAGEDHPEVLTTGHLLASLHRQSGDLSAARRVLENALYAGAHRHGDDHPMLLTMSYDLAEIADELGNRHEARRHYARVASYGPGAGFDPQRIAAAQAWLGPDTPVRPQAPAPQPTPSQPFPALPATPAAPSTRLDAAAPATPADHATRPGIAAPVTPADPATRPGAAAPAVDGPTAPPPWPPLPADEPRPEPQRPTLADRFAPMAQLPAGPPIHHPAPPQEQAPPPPRLLQPLPDLDLPHLNRPGGPAPADTTATAPAVPAQRQPAAPETYPQQRQPIAPQRPLPAADQPFPAPATDAQPFPLPATEHAPAQPSPGRPGQDGPMPQLPAGIPVVAPPDTPVRHVLQQPATLPAPVVVSPTGPAPAPPAPRGRGPVIAAVAAAVVAIVAAAVTLVLVVLPQQNDPKPGADVRGAATDLFLTEHGDKITLSWTDPSDGVAAQWILVGRPGEEPQRWASPQNGVTEFTFDGLNPKYDYCFAVMTIYSGKDLLRSALVCTNRTVTPSASS